MALVWEPERERSRLLYLTEAVDRADAERAVRKHLGLGRRKMVFEPTTPEQRAWQATIAL